jgi:hypothetical protein
VREQLNYQQTTGNMMTTDDAPSAAPHMSEPAKTRLAALVQLIGDEAPVGAMLTQLSRVLVAQGYSEFVVREDIFNWLCAYSDDREAFLFDANQAADNHRWSEDGEGDAP